MQRPVTIGTRGSPLALAQTRMVQAQLAAAFDIAETERDEAFPIEIVRTSGDRIQDRALADAGGKGLFTKELELALVDGRIDVAVHSLKDMPAKDPPGLVIVATPPREDPRDALIALDAFTLSGLPEGAIVGSASARRAAQVLWRRPDVEIVLLRGNVESRLAKVTRGVVDATFLAQAGLNRLGLTDAPSAAVSVDDMLPAACQGVVAVQARADDGHAQDVAALATDADTAVLAAAERAFLAALDGSCRTPLAALCERADEGFRLRGEVYALDGSQRWAQETRWGAAADAVGEARRHGTALGERLREEADPAALTPT